MLIRFQDYKYWKVGKITKEHCVHKNTITIDRASTSNKKTKK